VALELHTNSEGQKLISHTPASRPQEGLISQRIKLQISNPRPLHLSVKEKEKKKKERKKNTAMSILRQALAHETKRTIMFVYQLIYKSATMNTNTVRRLICYLVRENIELITCKEVPFFFTHSRAMPAFRLKPSLGVTEQSTHLTDHCKNLCQTV
jgi:hypothetical protein